MLKRLLKKKEEKPADLRKIHKKHSRIKKELQDLEAKVDKRLREMQEEDVLPITPKNSETTE